MIEGPEGFGCLSVQVVQFVKSEEYARFSRIIFDTAPTGHTLRLLSVPDFVEASLDKIIPLRKKLGSAEASLRGLFGASAEQDSAVQKLEGLKVSTLSPMREAWSRKTLGFDLRSAESLGRAGKRGAEAGGLEGLAP